MTYTYLIFLGQHKNGILTQVSSKMTQIMNKMKKNKEEEEKKEQEEEEDEE